MPDARQRLILFAKALAKAQLKRFLGDETVQALAEVAVDTWAEEITRWLDNEKVRKHLATALEKADQCLAARTEDEPTRQFALGLPTRGLPSLQVELDPLDEEGLERAVRDAMTRDWKGLTESQIAEASDVYMACLREALLGIEKTALLVIGRSVLRTERKVDELRSRWEAWMAGEVTPKQRIRLHKNYLMESVLKKPWTKISMKVFESRKHTRGGPRRKMTVKPVKISAIYTPLPVELDLWLRFDKQGHLKDWWVGGEEKPATEEMKRQKSFWERLFKPSSSTFGKKHLERQRGWPDMGLDEKALQPLVDQAAREIGKDKKDETVLWRPSASQAARLRTRFVLVGDPGSGKSTFLRHLAVTWAEALLEQLQGTGPSQKEATPLGRDAIYTPIYIELRRLVTFFPSLPPGDSPPAEVVTVKALDRFLEATLPAAHRGDMLELLRGLLKRGKAAILLDGLDEISQADDRRRQEQIQEFVADLEEAYPLAPIIVTARPYAYRQSEWQLEGFGRAALAPLPHERQVMLARRLFRQIEPGRAEEETRAFARALEKIPADLCSNPLLLTLLIVIWQRREEDEHELPDTRGELYRRALMFLLDDWVKMKQKGVPMIKDFNAEELLFVLQLVAARAQEKRKNRSDEAVITRGDFYEELDNLGRYEIGKTLIERLKKQAGMLLDIVQESPGPLYESYAERFRFLHLTFQEYLTACEYLYRHPGDQGRPLQLPVYDYRRFPDGLANQVIAAPDLWHNVLRLAIDELIYRKRNTDAWLLLSLICRPYLERKEAPLAALLALEVAEDIKLFARYLDMGVVGYYNLLQQAARKALTDVKRFRDPEQRDIAGRLLGWGDFPGHDPRPGVGVKEGLPDFHWVCIPAGEFPYQNGTWKLKQPFWITRFPVTRAQFETFLQAEDGFYNPEWWKGLAASESHRRSPGQQRFEYWNHPRERVSWYDAVAFSRWLTDKAREHPDLLPPELRGKQNGWRITLPTEWQWERAARGTGGRKYPWGSEYESGYANVDEKNSGVGPYYLEKTSAVGMYPQGATPEPEQKRVCDLSGNVWEWCLNEYEQPEPVQETGDAPRALRGGSWDDDPHDASAIFRNWDIINPFSRFFNVGFRLVVSVHYFAE